MDKIDKKSLILILLPALVFGFLVFKETKAVSYGNIVGWAWSENIGWISFNCLNQDTCGKVNYGVNIDKKGKLSGQAWSEHIGWITFNKDDLKDCPSGSCEGKLDLASYQISGWARALAYKDPAAGGWDGWIRLRDLEGGKYGAYISKQDKEFKNWVWSDNVIGWISLNCQNQDSCDISKYRVKFLGIKPETVNLRADEHNPADYCFVVSYAPVRLRWDFLSSDPEASQSAYRVEIYQGVNLVDRSCDSSLSDPQARCTSGSKSYLSTKLAYDKTYSWKLTVWDNDDNQSDLTSGPNFTTIPHPYPLPDFDWTPVRPAAQEVIQMNDLTNFYDSNPSLRTWSWDFGDGAHSDLSEPTHSYDNPNLSGYSATLQVADGDTYGPCSLSKNLSVTFPAPEWQEAPPPTE